MFIYQIENKINHKIYIGMTKEDDINTRLIKHIKRSKYNENRPLYSAFKKYGVNNFEISIIETCKTIEEMCEREKYWIKKLNSFVPNGYNISIGGEGGDTYTYNPNKSEILKKISQKISGENHYLFGKHLPEETRKKISDKHKGLLSGNKNGMFGKKHSEESIEKMRQNYSGGKQKGFCHVIYVLKSPTGETIEIKTFKNLMNFFDYSRLILDKGECNGYKLIKKLIRNNDGSFSEK